MKDEFLKNMLKEYKPVKDNLIQILNEIQEHFGYVPKEAPWFDINSVV